MTIQEQVQETLDELVASGAELAFRWWHIAMVSRWSMRWRA